jgi:hypothetical protein
MKRALVIVFAVVGVLGLARDPAAQSTAANNPLDLVGTWTLERTEVGADGKRVPVPNPRGLLILDAAGYAFEVVTRANRQQPEGEQPRLTAQQLTFAQYGGFWGRYKADAQKKTLTFQAEGAVSPNVMGSEFTRSFELTGDRLTITATAREPHVAPGTSWRWEKVPHVENLSPTYRQVIGFWQHVVEKRMNLTTGATISETRRAPSIIVYTPSGYVGVHFPPLNRQKFAGDTPTEAEARAALMGYVGYFGALVVYPNMVFHQVLTGVGLAGSTLKRPLELSGNEVTIKFPPTTNQQGQQMSTWVTLKRLSGEEAMIPKR